MKKGEKCKLHPDEGTGSSNTSGGLGKEMGLYILYWED